jgi:cytochrome c peroxidase
MRKILLGTVLCASVGCFDSQEEVESVASALSSQLASNPSGWAQSISLTGDIDLANPFFQVLGTNGRTCETCHDARAGWTITPAFAQAQFDLTGGLPPVFPSKGLAPLFRPHDASTNPAADHSTVSQRATLYRLVTSRGLIHNTKEVPAGAQYLLTQVDDPYGSSTTAQFLRFRRPNPISNEGLTQTVTWNGINQPPAGLLQMVANLAHQFHAQDPIPLSGDERKAMAGFMASLIHAQAEDLLAGPLDADGARGGVRALAQERFVLGENDPASPGFNPQVFTLFGAWAGLSGSARNEARAAIARGEAVFNTKPFTIEGVAGLNDALGQRVIQGTCSTCHNTPNIGHHSLFRPMNIGTAAIRAPGSRELPHLHLVSEAFQQTVILTDLGQGLDTGKWADLGKFSVPRLRGLASRAPYFHAGSAASLDNVVGFYQFRFGINFSGTERADLVAFLAAL